MAAIDNAARLDRDWLSRGMSDLGSIRSRATLQGTEGQGHYLAIDRLRVVTTSLRVICVDFGRAPEFPEFSSGL
jgi:hypothetical protein